MCSYHRRDRGQGRSYSTPAALAGVQASPSATSTTVSPAKLTRIQHAPSPV